MVTNGHNPISVTGRRDPPLYRYNDHSVTHHYHQELEESTGENRVLRMGFSVKPTLVSFGSQGPEGIDSISKMGCSTPTLPPFFVVSRVNIKVVHFGDVGTDLCILYDQWTGRVSLVEESDLRQSPLEQKNLDRRIRR